MENWRNRLVWVGSPMSDGCSCGGGGGVGPQLNAGAVVAAFPDPAEQIRWVMLGTAGYKQEGTATYGADKKVVGSLGVMPAQIDGLTREMARLAETVRQTAAQIAAPPGSEPPPPHY